MVGKFQLIQVVSVNIKVALVKSKIVKNRNNLRKKLAQHSNETLRNYLGYILNI